MLDFLLFHVFLFLPSAWCLPFLFIYYFFNMRILSTKLLAFVAISPLVALSAPIQTPPTVDSLLALAKGNPVILLKDLGPVATRLDEHIKAMEAHAKVSGESKSGSHPHSGTTPQGSSTPESSATTGAPESKAPGATAPEATGSAAGSSGGPTTPEATPAGGDPAPAAPVQRRSETSGNSDPSHSHHKAHKNGHSAKYDPHVDLLKPADLLKLHNLITETQIYYDAIAKIVLDAGKNIEPIPSDKTAEGSGWGIINGLTFGLEKIATFAREKDD